MDGFSADTSVLADAGGMYATTGGQLESLAARLQKARNILLTQNFGDITGLLSAAFSMCEQSALEAKRYGVQCAAIAEAYERTERQVAAVVAALPSAPSFSSAGNGGSALETARVKSRYIPAKPVLLAGNQLPSEGWLLERAIKQNIEGESEWK